MVLHHSALILFLCSTVSAALAGNTAPLPVVPCAPVVPVNSTSTNHTVAATPPTKSSAVQSSQKTAPAPKAADSDTDSILGAYVGVSRALSRDNLQAAVGASAKLKMWADISEDAKLLSALDSFRHSTDLESARNDFKVISHEMIPMADDAGPHYVMTCPQVGAEWMQLTRAVSNPYLGKKQLHCGRVAQHITD